MRFLTPGKEDLSSRVECGRGWALISTLLISIAAVPLLLQLESVEALLLSCAVALVLCVRFVPVSSGALSNISNQRLGWIWGALLPLLPACGRSSVGVFSLVVVRLLLGKAAVSRGSAWLVPLLVLILGSVVAEVFIGAHGFFASIATSEPGRLAQALHWFLKVHAHSWGYLSGLIVFLFVVQLFDEKPELLGPFRRGLIWGVAASSLLTLAQFFEIGGIRLHGQKAFWSSVNRIAGSFSDPNAQGVFLGLAPFVLISGGSLRRSERYLTGITLALAVSAGLLSGSRTFMVAVIVSLASVSWFYSRRIFVAALVSAAVAVFSITLADLYSPWLGAVLQSSWLPEGARRVIESCSLPRAPQMFFSRAVFWKMALELFSFNPFFGVGADRFRFYVPAVSEKLALGLRGWTDNSNSFYLGILTELGLFGLLAFLLVALGRKPKVSLLGSVSGIGLLVLGTTLLTGPHLDFPEVMIIAAVLIAAATRASVVPTGSVLMSACFFGLVGLLSALSRDQGGYDWEASGDQWLSPQASVSVACGCDGLAELHLESLYVPTRMPLRVFARSEFGEHHELVFQRAEVKRLTVSCLSVPSEAIEHQPGTVKVLLSTEIGWSPSRAWPGKSDDTRVLGIRLRERSWRDLFGADRCPWGADPAELGAGEHRQ